MMRRVWLLPVMMIVPSMQSISGDDDNTYASHMAPLMASTLGLPCQPCSEPRQLIAGDYYFLVTIFGFVCHHICISGYGLPFLCGFV